MGDKRSSRAAAAERILRAVNDGHLSSAEASEEFLERRSADGETDLPLRLMMYRDHESITEFRGTRILSFGEKEGAAHTVLYLHGGGYVSEILPFHVIFCRHLAERIRAHVMAPLYPLAPKHTWRDTYSLLTDLYSGIFAEKRTDLTIMGDSAGGGLAIGFCQYLRDTGLPQPDHLIGISPWVDISMTSGEYEQYRITDPMLDVPGLRVYGKAWAGDLDVRDPKVSPIFGSCRGLPKTLLFTGTREILYPDILAFYEKMKADGCDAELVIGEGMNHVYPLYGLPESRAAAARIEEEITGERGPAV